MRTNNLDKHSNSNSNERNQQKLRYSRVFQTWFEVLDVDLALCHILQYDVECCWQQNRQCLWACVWGVSQIFCHRRSLDRDYQNCYSTWRRSTPWFMHLPRRRWKKYSSAQHRCHRCERPQRRRPQIFIRGANELNWERWKFNWERWKFNFSFKII